jgi:signal transduction histidine kinase
MACLAVLAIAALAVGPLTSSAPLVTVAIGIGIAIAGLLCARALRAHFKHEAEFRRSVAEAATARERRRIAADLHDGLAQDLAFIVAHGDRLAVEMGAEYPLAIAARRALAVSRGAIEELSAAHAPTAADALRYVANELGSRFDIQVDVRAEPKAVMAVTPAHREHIVRVSLARAENTLVLTVRDDGIGIGAAVPRGAGGFGMVNMRERTMTLGGRLTARTPADGGTEVELVVPLSGSPTRPARRRAA